MSTIYNHIYHIYLYVCIMSKQILNIVFPPPSALNGEKSCGGSGELSHLITRAGLKPGPLTIRCRRGHHTFPTSAFEDEGFSPDEDGAGAQVIIIRRILKTTPSSS